MNAADLARLLAPDAGSGLHDVDAVSRADIAKIAVPRGWVVFRMDCAALRDKAGFLAAAVATFDLPPYFGGNWDALEDCLSSLEWRPAAGYVVLVEGTSAFARNSPADAATAREVFTGAARAWAGRAAAFHVLWVVGARGVP